MIKNLSQEQAEKMVWDRFFKDNPHLQRGETMTSPVGMAIDGKLVTHMSAEPTQDQVLTAQSYRVDLTDDWDLPNMEMPHLRGWVYPYKVALDYKFAPPEGLTVMDPDTLQPVSPPQIIHPRHICIRFAAPEKR